MTEGGHPEHEGTLNEGGRRMAASGRHWYPHQEVLKGRLTQESLSVEVLRWMDFEYRHWTSPHYADNLPPNIVRQAIIDNVRSEVELAIAEFISRHGEESGSLSPVQPEEP